MILLKVFSYFLFGGHNETVEKVSKRDFDQLDFICSSFVNTSPYTLKKVEGKVLFAVKKLDNLPLLCDYTGQFR